MHATKPRRYSHCHVAVVAVQLHIGKKLLDLFPVPLVFKNGGRMPGRMMLWPYAVSAVLIQREFKMAKNISRVFTLGYYGLMPPKLKKERH